MVYIFREGILGSFGTVMTGLVLWCLRRGRHFLEKRIRGTVNSTNHAASISGHDSPTDPWPSTPEVLSPTVGEVASGNPFETTTVKTV